jgi:hypothetical protein
MPIAAVAQSLAQEADEKSVVIMLEFRRANTVVTRYTCANISEGRQPMMWLTGIVCLAIGVAAGLLIARRVDSNNPGKVEELEARVQELQRFHDEYREHVSDHFSMTADLVHQMTDSYRDVHKHLARGAQDLCDDEIAGKLLPSADQMRFGSNEDDSQEPPKDYAPKRTSGQSGALSESFGLDRRETSDNKD